MKTVKTWDLFHIETQTLDSVYFHVTEKWLRRTYNLKAWKVVRVEIREVPKRKVTK